MSGCFGQEGLPAQRAAEFSSEEIPLANEQMVDAHPSYRRRRKERVVRLRQLLRHRQDQLYRQPADSRSAQRDHAVRWPCRGRFGVAFDPQGSISSVIGPNGAGKTTLSTSWRASANRRPATSSSTAVPSIRRRALLGGSLRPDQITQLGISRTFQNIRLFGNMSVLENDGRHAFAPEDQPDHGNVAGRGVMHDNDVRSGRMRSSTMSISVGSPM